jgi:predicted ATPase/class 3 adenylate cyclase
MSELPTGTVTFLFTDLEGSTRLWEEHPEAMRAALARHDEILRDAVEKRDGHVVKTTGDGLHAVFALAPDGVVAALDAQRALVAEDWTLPEPLRVRMGLHMGGAELRGGDYYGPAVNRAARVSGAAHGGQIVASAATADLVRDDLGETVELVDLGEHRLRDLGRPERIVQIAHPDLPSDFPPLRSLDAYPGNLPVQLTSFVGRGPELEGIVAALEDVRLVTITGTGGVGKTRLAVQVAADVLPRFADGVWLCELAPATDVDTMHQVVVATLGVQPRAGVSLEESIIEFLRSKDLLVLFDNCEHLLRPVRDLAGVVLQSCPGVRILVTSREGLGLPGEQVWPLRSLDVPNTTSTGDVAGAEAAMLFAERAHAVRPDFKIDDDNADAVADICRRLDGIPLALELAAARIVAMSPTDIAARLDERFRLLTGGRHAAIERHQTLRGAVDWSYSLLDADERTVFDRLAVFSGTFDARAAEAVAAGEGVEGWDVLDALTSLVAKSMVVAEPASDGVMRYQLLETIRQYAAQRLDEGGAPDRWRRRHAEHYAAVAEELAAGIRGPDELAWRNRLDTELDNLRSVVHWSIDAPEQVDADLGLRIIAALSYEATINRPSGVGAWAELAVDRAEQSMPARRADVLGAASYNALTQGDHVRARALALSALRDDAQADSWSPGVAYLTLSYAALATGHDDELRRTMTEWRDALEAIGADDYDRVVAQGTMASFGALLGDPEALQEAQAATRAARRIGNPDRIAMCLLSLGMNLARSAPDEALAALEECIGIMRVGTAAARRGALGSALSNVAQLRARQGDQLGALTALRESIACIDRIGDRPQLVAAVDWAIAILERFGHPDPTAVLVGVAVDGPLAALNNFPGARRVHGDAKLAPLETELGTDTYRALVEQGAAMSYEEVVHFLFDEIDRLLAEEAAADA